MRKRLGGSLLSPRVALSLEGNPRAPLPTTRARHQLLCWPPPQLAPSEAAAAASGNARIGVRSRARPSSLSFSLPHNTTRSSFGRWLQPPPGAHPPPACPPQTWRRLPRPVPACPVPLRRRRTSLLIPRSTSRSAAAQAGRALTGAARLLRHGGEGSLHRRAGSHGSLPPVASSYSPPPRRLRRARGRLPCSRPLPPATPPPPSDASWLQPPLPRACLHRPLLRLQRTDLDGVFSSGAALPTRARRHASLFDTLVGGGGRRPHNSSSSWPPPLGQRSRPCGVWTGPVWMRLGNDSMAPSLVGRGGPFSLTDRGGPFSPMAWAHPLPPSPLLAEAPLCTSSWLLLLLRHSGLHPGCDGRQCVVWVLGAFGESPSSPASVDDGCAFL